MLLIASVAMASLLSTASLEEAQGLNDNRVVYWGNMVTGASVRVVNQANAEKKAEALVKKAGGSGWVLLANSGAPGFGAAICERRGTLNSVLRVAWPRHRTRSRDRGQSQGRRRRHVLQ